METKILINWDKEAQFNQQLKNGIQVLTFEVAESEKDGILLIDGNNLNFKFLR